jgi:uncharacterized protein YegJ (DUF2314 family)
MKMLKQMAMVLVMLTLAVSFSLNVAGCSKDTGWSSVSDDHPEIVAAREEAKAGYPEFVKLVKAKRPMTLYTVEVLYEEGGKSEYLTLDVLSANDTEIRGTIVGYPKEVDRHNMEEITAPASSISDWRVETPEGDVKGGYVSDVRARLQRAGTGG